MDLSQAFFIPMCACSTTSGTIQQYPPGALFRARLLDKQEGANTERYVFGKLLATRFQRRPFRHRHYSAVKTSTMENRPWGCDIHRRIRVVQKFMCKCAYRVVYQVPWYSSTIPGRFLHLQQTRTNTLVAHSLLEFACTRIFELL